MELDRRQRRRGKGRKEAEHARSIDDVSDDQLWLILLPIDSPIWLIRAACACKRWRRVVTNNGADEGRAFLLLASSFHPPTVVDQYHNYHVQVTVNPDNRFVPSSSSAAPPIDGCHIAVGHLRFKNSSCHVADCYGGLVLLRRIHRMSFQTWVPNLIVYDPLTHNHRKIYIPPPPHKQLDGADITDAFLLDGNDGDISVSNFRVFYCCFKSVEADADPNTCVFSTANGGDWRFLNDDRFTNFLGHVAAGRVNRSLYMGMSAGFVAALDNSSLVFSMVALPIRLDMLKILQRSTFTVVHDAGLGPASPPRTSIVHVRGEELELFRRVNDSGEWMLEHIISNLSETSATRDLLVSLEKKDRYMSSMWVFMKKKGIAWSTMASSINADGAASAILSARPSDDYFDNRTDCRCFFSIDVNTMELQVLPELPYCHKTRSIFTYTLPWPQFLRACVSTPALLSSSQDGRVDNARPQDQWKSARAEWASVSNSWGQQGCALGYQYM